MLRQLTSIITTLLALCASNLTYAQNWFEVEVYVFAQPHPTSEQWPDKPIPTKANQAVDFITPVIAPALTANALPDYPSVVPYQIAHPRWTYARGNNEPVLLSRGQSHFKNIINKLSKESKHTPLLHMTWQQPMVPQYASTPVRLFAGKDFSGTYTLDGRKINQSIQEASFDAQGMPIPATQMPPIWELDGTVNIYLSHYLYIQTALNLRQEQRKMQPTSTKLSSRPTHAEPEMIMTPYLMAIPLQQNRRVKSEEIHYFDHPEMGMIIQIRKMKQPNS